MYSSNKQISNQLYNIFREMYKDDESIQQAIRESKAAYSSVKRDALFRSIPTFMYDELR